ncbi:hypothetical protein HNQ06_000002 [Borrelia lanei]|uniref:Uncharacterized protein n=1 Tax=Borreliella lanei TaxID=373540 RepID=A0A7X0DKU4_9SPIR|nr:hypothetical protein [Borreliella lanei]
MKINDIVKTNDFNISLYKKLSKDFIKKENIKRMKDFFVFVKNRFSSIDNNSTETNMESSLNLYLKN